MAKNSARERAEKTLAKVDERLAALEARKRAALAKVEERFSEELAALTSEREHAASSPALRPTHVDETAAGA